MLFLGVVSDAAQQSVPFFQMISRYTMVTLNASNEHQISKLKGPE